jgi:hypothetical protein
MKIMAKIDQNQIPTAWLRLRRKNIQNINYCTPCRRSRLDKFYLRDTRRKKGDIKGKGNVLTA